MRNSESMKSRVLCHGNQTICRNHLQHYRNRWENKNKPSLAPRLVFASKKRGKCENGWEKEIIIIEVYIINQT